MSSRAWLAAVPWEMVVWQNERLCEAKSAHHGASSDGYAACKALWDRVFATSMSLEEMVDLCRRCHLLAPFTNYNGNTFSAIARAMIATLDLPEDKAALARSLAGHIVAGVAGDLERTAFSALCAKLGEAP